MNKIQIVLRTLLLIVSALIINTTAFAEPNNLSQLKMIVKKYHDTGAYQQELTKVINTARHDIAEYVRFNNRQSHLQN